MPTIAGILRRGSSVAMSVRTTISNTAADQERHSVPGQPSHWFATKIHSTKDARKITSTVHENGGQAITISANPSHAARFRKRNHWRSFKYLALTTGSRRRAA